MHFKFLDESRPPDCIVGQSAVRELKENEGKVLLACWGHEGPCALSHLATHRGLSSTEEVKHLFSHAEGWEWILLMTW